MTTHKPMSAERLEEIRADQFLTRSAFEELIAELSRLSAQLAEVTRERDEARVEIGNTRNLWRHDNARLGSQLAAAEAALAEAEAKALAAINHLNSDAGDSIRRSRALDVLRTLTTQEQKP